MDNNCGAAAVWRDATGKDGSNDDHTLLRLLGGFAAVVRAPSLVERAAEEGATKHRLAAEYIMEGRTAVMKREFLDERFLIALGDAIAVEVNYADQLTEAAAVAQGIDYAASCKLGRTHTSKYQSGGKVDSEVRVHVINRARSHWYTHARTGAYPMSVQHLRTRAQAAFRTVRRPCEVRDV